jgi:hypothetical protein
MGEQVIIDAGKLKAPHATALDSGAARAERSAKLVNECIRDVS